MIRTIALMLVVMVACTREPPPPSDRPESSMALRYAPGTSPTDRQIAGVQAELRKRPTADGYVALSELFMRRRRETFAPVMMDYAKAAAKRALALSPEDPRAMLLLGRALHYGHAFSSAAVVADKVLARNPKRYEAYHLRGDARLELGDYEGAIDAYQAAMDIRPDLRAYNRAAYVAWMHGDAEGAIRWLDLALGSGSARDPESSAWCFVDLGEIYRHRGDTRRAVAAADRALALQPAYVPALLLRGRARSAAGDFDNARDDYRRAVERLPTVESLVELAEVHEALGESVLAASRRKQARALAPTDPRPMAHDLARRAQAIERAVQLAELELSARRNVAAWDTYGLALIRAGRLDEAEAALDQAGRLNSPIAEVELHRALLAVARNRRSQAKDALDRARRQNPLVDRRLVTEIEEAL